MISILAAVCSTTASAPQLLGKVGELSNATMVIRFTGAVLWSVYGALILEYALVASSCVAASVELCLFVRTNYRFAQNKTKDPNENALENALENAPPNHSG